VEKKLFKGKKCEILDRPDLQPQPKTNFYLTRPTIKKHITTLIHRTMTERMPYDIGEIVIFGSYIKGKEKPNDLDIVLIDAEKKTTQLSYLLGREWFTDLLQMRQDQRNHNMIWYLSSYGYAHFDSCPYITSKLLRRGMKNVHIKYEKNFSDFVRRMKVNEEMERTGLDFKVIWSSSWVDEKDMKCWKQHPLTPFIRYLHTVENTNLFKEFNIDYLHVFDEIIKKPIDIDDKEYINKTSEVLKNINR
jgi:predicted nucleotidyltransferase